MSIFHGRGVLFLLPVSTPLIERRRKRNACLLRGHPYYLALVTPMLYRIVIDNVSIRPESAVNDGRVLNSRLERYSSFGYYGGIKTDWTS